MNDNEMSTPEPRREPAGETVETGRQSVDPHAVDTVNQTQPTTPLPSSLNEPEPWQMPQVQPAVPATAPTTGSVLPPLQPAAKQHRLSRFMLVSIVLLSALTIASIALLFIGGFEGRFERVFSTFSLFAVFVLLTAFDTRRDQGSEWYAPVALVANAYILGLGLIVVWVTPYDPFSLMWEIIWKVALVIVITRAAIFACQMLLKASAGRPESVGLFAFISSALAVLSAVLYTAPVGVDAFRLHVPDMYWRIATAVLILTGLALSITLLLRWFYSSDERAERRRAAAQAAQAVQDPSPYIAGPQQHAGNVGPVPVASVPAPQPQHQTQPAGGLLPWPTFPDGQPYPAGPDGQPDFEAAQRR